LARKPDGRPQRAADDDQKPDDREVADSMRTFSDKTSEPRGMPSVASPPGFRFAPRITTAAPIEAIIVTTAAPSATRLGASR